MFAGLIGGFIGEYDLKFPFILSASIMALAILAIHVLVQDKLAQDKLVQDNPVQDKLAQDQVAEGEEKSKDISFNFSMSKSVNLSKMNERVMNFLRSPFAPLTGILKTALKDGMFKAGMGYFFVILALVQFAYQPVLHYWQPYFHHIDSTLSAEFMGKIFFLYVLSFIIGSFFSSEMIKRQLISTSKLIFIEAILLFIFFMVIAMTRNIYVAVGSFLVMQALGNNFRSLVNAEFNRKIETDNRATVLSTLSFISRLGMIAALLLIKFSKDSIHVPHFFIGSAFAFMLILIVSYRVHWSKHKH